MHNSLDLRLVAPALLLLLPLALSCGSGGSGDSGGSGNPGGGGPGDPTEGPDGWLVAFADIGVPNGTVHALEPVEDADGVALVVAGAFSEVGGAAALSIARLDLETWSWSPLGSGLAGGEVLDLAAFDDGSGAALYAVGSFGSSAGTALDRIARWDGVEWSAVGGGLGGGFPARALAVFDDGGGPALFAAGSFSVAGGAPADRIARWDGVQWSGLGTPPNNTIEDLAVFDDSFGSAHYAVGSFTAAGGQVASRVARWNGSTWSSVGTPASGLDVNSPAFAVAGFDAGTGAEVFLGGAFGTVDGGFTPAPFVAAWDGANWSSPGGGMDFGVEALATFDDGGGEALYAGGSFQTAGGVPASRIARWDGVGWSALGDGVAGTVRALAVVAAPPGGAPLLAVGGSFAASPGGDAFVALYRGAGASVPTALGAGAALHADPASESTSGYAQVPRVIGETPDPAPVGTARREVR